MFWSSKMHDKYRAYLEKKNQGNQDTKTRFCLTIVGDEEGADQNLNKSKEHT